MSTGAERKEIRDALAKIAEENGGLLTPDAVVAAAASKSSVLHGEFEWDAKKAAHAHRIEQARTLIRSVRVVITTDKTTVSTVAYVRDPDVERDEQGYCATASLVGDIERARAALVNEFSRAAAALRRARELAVAFSMEGEVEAVTASVDSMRTRIEAKVEQRAAA
jgi:hypothetical protein